MSLSNTDGRKTAMAMIAAGALGLFATTAADADIIEMTLHGYCGASAATSTCTDNNVITPTGSNPLLEFGFTRSPDNNTRLTTPTFELVFLVPDTATDANSQTLTYTGTGTGVTTATTLTLIGDFTGGTLDAFLHLTRTGGPNNPIGGFQAGETNQGLPSTGFYVYQASFGSVTFGAPDPTFVPSGGFTGGLIQGTEIYALVEGSAPNTRQDGAALSSTIIEVSKPPLKEASEPGSVALLGIGFLGIALTSRRKSRAVGYDCFTTANWNNE